MNDSQINTCHRVVIVHGSFSSPEENWFSWLKKKLESHGHMVIVPCFPTPNGQTLSAWLKIFRSEIGELTPRTVLIGHSLGAGFVLNLLEKTVVPIRATFLVAGFLGKLGLPDYDAVNESFVSRQFDWQRIRSNAGKSFILAGDDDPYVPLQKGREIADLLHVPLTIISSGGHLNSESGFSSFPLLAKMVVSLLV